MKYNEILKLFQNDIDNVEIVHVCKIFSKVVHKPTGWYFYTDDDMVVFRNDSKQGYVESTLWGFFLNEFLSREQKIVNKVKQRQSESLRKDLKDV